MPSAPRSEGDRRALAVAAGAALVVVVMLVTLPLLPEPRTQNTFRIAAYGTQLVWFAVVMAFAATVASRWHVRARTLAAAIIGSFVIAMACNVLAWSIPADVAKVVFGSFAGAAFVRAIDRPWWLLPIGVCVPLADAWSVFSSRGVTKAVINRAAEEPRWIEWPTIATPIAGLDYDQFGRLGTVDILFSALFLAAAWRWKLSVVRVAVALTLSLVASTVIVMEVENLAIPALPLLCLAFLLVAGRALARDLRESMRANA